MTEPGALAESRTNSDARGRPMLLGLLALAIVLFCYAFRPFVEVLLLAAVLAGALYPLQRWLTARLWNRGSLGAGLLCFLVMITVLAPLAGFTFIVARETIAAARIVSETVSQDGIMGLLDRAPQSLHNAADYVLSRTPLEGQEVLAKLRSYVAQQGSRVASMAALVLTQTGVVLLHAALMLVALYFFLLDGKRLVAWLERVLPLKPGRTAELLREFRGVSASVLSSTLVTAVLQTLIAVPGYLIAGVPKPWLFTAGTFFLSFVPTVGAGSACMIAALTLLLMDQAWMALLIAVWGAVLVGLADNIVKPIIARRGMHMHGGLIFFALVSGLAAFGPIGLLLGPLSVSFLLAVIRMCERDFERAA
jgi:predicted PurR-regulated permease PerM